MPLDQPEFAVAAYGALAGALAGALVTGSISYLLQRHAFNEMKKQREEDRKRSQQVLGHTMLLKMLKICENFRSLDQVFTNTVARQRGATEEELWRYVRASANLPDRVHFSPEEMAMLSAMKDDNVFATVLQVDDFHNAVLDTANVYGTRRTKLHERLGSYIIPGQSGGPFREMHIDAKQKSVLEPLIIDVNDIAKHLLQRIPTGLEVSEKALDVLYKALHQELGITFKNELLSRPQCDNEYKS